MNGEGNMDEQATNAAPDAAALDAFGASLRGRLIRPGDASYDEARAVWNGMIDRRPAAIAQCAGTADVIHAVNFARGHGMLVSVRGGGHNVAGSAIVDGGLVIDLSKMRAVRVDPARQTVRAEGGVTIGDLDHETTAFGLAVPLGVVTETGIAGLTLGGGLGWLRRKYGLSCDNLIAADVVTADGRLVHTGESENPDLLWGLRGGGGNFGIVTSFEFRAHPIPPELYVAFVIHPADGAPGALRFYREWAADAPDEVSGFAILWHGPELEEIPAEHHGEPIVVFLAVHAGDPAEGERVLQPLRGFGDPIADMSGPMPFLDLQQFFDEDYPAGEMHYYWKSAYLRDLPDEAINRLAALNAQAPSPHSSLDLWQLGGAMSRVGPEETAFGDRSAPFMLGIEANWEDPAADAANVAWAREVFEAARPFATGAQYMNFPGFYEGGESDVRDTFGGNYARLVELKKKYDPENMFRLNQNVKPG
jgi:FAD/FMN-containing dehydrogenase